MYREHFGLKDLPFAIAPDPRYLYLSAQHEDALAHLLYGVSGDGGFVLLTGEVGTGKTTICRWFLEKVPEDTDVAFVLNPKVSAGELLETICDELGIIPSKAHTSRKSLIDRINAFLLENHARGRRTVLILEEAQNLGMDVLEQVRLLTNLETNDRKLLQIIMIGQPELREMLARRELRQLSQRITARFHLLPLKKKETAAYVEHRLAVAGTTGRLFPARTLGLLFRLSKGIPRVINLVCDRALLGAYVKGKDSVDRSTLATAAEEVLGKREKSPLPRSFRWAAASLVLIILGAIFGASVFTGPGKAWNSSSDGSGYTAAVSLPATRDREAVFEPIFEQWNILYESAAGPACRQSDAHGLRCLEEQGGLRDLVSLNRPAVVRLKDRWGLDAYAALIEVCGGMAVLQAKTERKTVTVEELERHWSGWYTVLWRTPPAYAGEIKTGSSGPAVLWLDIQLARLEGRNAKPGKSVSFDAALAGQLKQFQRAKGLPADGTAGARTIIHLNNAAGSDEPRLLCERNIL